MPMTDIEIEREAEKRMNALDKKLLRHQLTQKEYDEEVAKLSSWATRQYNTLLKEANK